MKATKIDKQAALEMMLKGESDTKIAERFGSSRQAVNLLRKSFAGEGKLETQSRLQEPPGLESSPPGQMGHHSIEEVKIAPRTDERRPSDPTYDQITAWMVRIINDAAQVQKQQQDLKKTLERSSELEQEIVLLRGQLANAKQDLASVMAKAAEYQQAIQRLRTSGNQP